MKPETRMKIRRKLMPVKNFIREWAPPIAIGLAGGMLIGGYVGTIDNSIQIGKINKRLDTHAKVINGNADALEGRTNYLKTHQEELEKKVEELQRQNNLLLEKALRETNGEA